MDITGTVLIRGKIRTQKRGSSDVVLIAGHKKEEVVM